LKARRLAAATALDTEACGAHLARALGEARETFVVIYLVGELGAGKTTLVRGFLRALGHKGPVRSPTYTLLEIYEADSLTVLHLDLYRLRDPSEIEGLGLSEWALPGHIWLIEWPDRAGSRLTPPDLLITLTARMADHEIAISAKTTAGESWLSRL
jgi:tRNA threonylcarbamoyladenosine biosynthesis protein TsaE